MRTLRSRTGCDRLDVGLQPERGVLTEGLPVGVIAEVERIATEISRSLAAAEERGTTLVGDPEEEP
jgi:hypothetical protein